MNIGNSIIVVFSLLLPIQAYSMMGSSIPKQPLVITNNSLKRTASKDIISPSPEKKTRTEDTIDPFLSEIKQNIHNFDSTSLNNLLITNSVKNLTKEDRQNLYSYAKQSKTNIKAINALSSKIKEQTDNQEIKTKFSYDTEYQELQKITRNLKTLTILPKLTFPQAFFTQAPYTKDPRITLDQILARFIKNEQQQISACCYHITLDTISKALINKKNKGITIEVATNQNQGDQLNASKEISTLINNNIPVFWPHNDNYEQMHHKFFIFERNILNKKLLWLGSYNPTPNGNTRSWDDVTILDDADIIKLYQQRFKEVKSRSKTITT